MFYRMVKSLSFICLVRHGETDWNVVRKIQGRTDIPLNEKGIIQAQYCKKYLSKFQWDVIVSSPLQRARQTAEIINTELRLPFIVMDEFIERHYGDVEGLTIEERSSMFPDFQCPNQENFELVKNRVMEGINKLHQIYPNKKTIVVAHGGVINTLLFVLSNGEIGSGKTKLFNGCLSHIYLYKNEWKIKNYNQTSHLLEYDYL